MTGNDPDGENKRSVRQYSADYMEGFLDELTRNINFSQFILTMTPLILEINIRKR